MCCWIAPIRFPRYRDRMSSRLVGKFPEYRPRRLRRTPALRQMLAETDLRPHHLILPLFVRAGSGLRKPISSMPGVFQLSVDEAVKEAQAAYNAGVPAVLLFGIPETKDEHATGAFDPKGSVQEATRALKKALPQLVVITDVCLCEYMSHGHCGIVETRANSTEILNDPTLEILGRAAASHVQAGADIVAPSDMMDGRIRAIRQALDSRGFTEAPIISYAAKFASAFYGPFREAAESAPQFGDRRSYQMHGANALEALREVAMDIEEGADMVMVKPALAYLDILWRVKSEFGYPTVAYAVSAEYSMIQAAAERGWIDRKGVLLESHYAMRRAGADLIITYAARDLAQWLSAQTP